MQNVLIQTCNLDDGAVTADKIDFTTFTSGFSLPIASRTQGLGYGFNATLYRFGNIVFCSGSGTNSYTVPDGEGDLTETIPSGYRPSDSGWISGVGGFASAPSMGLRVTSAGVLRKYTNAQIPTPRRLTFCGIWTTNNDWPQ